MVRFDVIYNDILSARSYQYPKLCMKNIVILGFFVFFLVIKISTSFANAILISNLIQIKMDILIQYLYLCYQIYYIN